MDITDVRTLLKRTCEDNGGQSCWARANDMSAAYVCDILMEKREPGPKVLDALGLEKIVTYRAKEAHHHG